jgi:RimJ/RimL family protein N-acetyltransferase
MTLPPFSPIETPRLLLRHFRDEDVLPMFAYRQDSQVARYQGWNPATETIEEVQERVQEMRDRTGATEGAWFQIAVEEKATATLIGDLGLRLRGGEPRQAVVGYTFARHAQGKGYATEAMGALLDYTFTTLGAHRVMADALAENSRSVRLLERLGFQKEGHFREAEWFEGYWADDVIYGILKREWLDRSPSPL